jgi:hypothetical protein
MHDIWLKGALPMKHVFALLVVIVLLGSSIGTYAEVETPGCAAVDTIYFEEHLYPIFEDYTVLRKAFVAEGDIGQTGGELIGLRAQLTAALEESPACLDRFVLDLALSMADTQTGILFLILSLEVDDSAMSERFQQIGLYYSAQSDAQYTVAAESIAGWRAKSLGIEGDPDADNA